MPLAALMIYFERRHYENNITGRGSFEIAA